MDMNISNPDFHDLGDDSGFVEDANNYIIKVIGVGGGGNNAVNYMFEQKIPYVNFVVCNTDKQALNMSPVPNKLLLGEEITKGLGAGNVPEVGRKCAEASKEAISALFQDQTEMVFITAGMGGGTGTGAAPVVARLAKEAGMLTIGIVTVPFIFEGEKKIYKALQGAKEMQKYVDALLLINNENLIELYKDLTFFNAFGKADDTLANAARSISEIISEPMYINVDFQDVKTTLKDSKTAIISTAIGEGKNRISDAINKALHSPLLKKHDINTSKRLLIKFMCSRDAENPLRAEEMAEITQFTNRLSKTLDVKWGIGDKPELGDSVKVTILATGFDVTIKEGDNSSSQKDKGEKDTGPIKFEGETENKFAVREEKGKVQTEEQKEIAEVYGTEKMKEHSRASDELRYVVLKPSQFDDFEVIAMLEKTPVFRRHPGFKDDLDKIGQPVRVADRAREPESNDEKGSNKITF